MLVKLGTISAEQLEQALAAQRDASAGLLDLIAGEPARNCIAETAMPNLWILPRGSVSAHQEVRLSPEAVRLVIETVRDQYDIVLVDTGPVPGTLGASIMNSLVDGVVVVLSRGAGRTQTQRAVNHLTLIGATIVGYVFNRAESRDFQMSYGSSISSPNVEKSRSGSQIDIATARRGAEKYGPVVSAVACSVDGPSRDPNTGKIRKTQPSP
jgi:Mrp family chromosome partitioning ATPase